ncbi:MAG: ABC transporter ATP-binding protein, partial [Erysipelothrix sp.]|nr:ABC transporter ATP-binding protein [Erysipelothrix sp.]
MSLKDLLFEKKSKMFLYVFGVLIASTTNIISTYGMSHAFSVLETESQGEVLSILLVTAILMILPALIQLASRMLRIGFMSDTLKSVRSLAYEKIMRKDIESFSSIEKEVYQSAMISDVNLFEKDFFLSVLNIGFALFSSIFSFILLFRYSWVVATISLTTSILLYMVSKLFENKVRDARKRTQERNQSFNTLSSNLISGFKTIKSFASEKVFFNRFSDEIESLESVKAEFFGLNKNQELISHGISSMATIIIFIIASALMYSGQIRISELIVVLNLSGSLIWGMINAISFVNRLKSSVDIYKSLVDVEEVNQKRGLNLGDCVLNVSDLS